MTSPLALQQWQQSNGVNELSIPIRRLRIFGFAHVVLPQQPAKLCLEPQAIMKPLKSLGKCREQKRFR
jgi:hypothetical protein